MIIDALCFALSGYFMKASDEFMDEKNNTIMAIITGILCVIFTVYISITNGDATCIFISILAGTALAFKVDSINHILSAILLIIVLSILGFPHFSLLCLILCTLAAYLDEKGNDLMDEKEDQGLELNLVEKLLKYRYIMKVTVFILSLFGLIQLILPNTFLDNYMFFEPMTIIYFYLFDLFYEFSNDLTDCFNNIFQGLLRIF